MKSASSSCCEIADAAESFHLQVSLLLLLLSLETHKNFYLKSKMKKDMFILIQRMDCKRVISNSVIYVLSKFETQK